MPAAEYPEAWVPGSGNQLAGDISVRSCGFQPGSLGQPAADEWGFAMNRTGLYVSLAAFVISGGLFAAMGYRVVANLHDARAGAFGHGSQAVPDPEYQKLPPDAGADWMDGFTLTERSGNPVQWNDLNGKVRITSFFFSSCPANCLQQNLKVREIVQAYAGKDVACLSITCDPDIDSPERLREYATKLNAPPDQWLFLTGRLIYIRRLANELFGVALDKQTHTERLIVCDKWGKVRGAFLWNKLDEMAQLRLLVDKLLSRNRAARRVIDLMDALPHINAGLNALATVLLIVGFIQIKRRREIAHKWTMLACFAVSTAFLMCYLTHHYYLKYYLHLPYGSRSFSTSCATGRATDLLSDSGDAHRAGGSCPLSRHRHDLAGARRSPPQPHAAGVVDIADLALRLGDRRDRLFDAVSTLPAPGLSR